MAIYYEQTNRLIIPRWRRFNHQNLSEEHKLLFTTPNAGNEQQRIKSLARKRVAWENERTFGNAWELVNSAYINQDFEAAREAARFLDSNLSTLSSRLQNVIKQILEGPSQLDLPTPPSIEAMPLHSLMDSTKWQIKKMKRKISFYLRSDLLWLELGRLYSILGELKKAEQCINIAIYFSTNENRYFLRSASRFFHHIGKYDEAQNIIRRSPWLKKDPWLLSADISYANKMGRHAVNAKQGFEVLDSNNYSNASITELAGVLGTMEFKNDSFQKARKLTRQSLLAPNDNSLAQAEWIAREIDQISIEQWIDKVEFGYEARTFEFLHEKNYEKTLEESMCWVMDQPFSKRACHFVSYFCTSVSPKYELAIEVGELGARSNPGYFPILNNLAYAYISAEDFTNAARVLEEMSGLLSGVKEQCFALATTGFFFYRTKDIMAGKEFYQRAIEVAAKANFQSLKNLAEANFLRERFFAGELSFLTAMNALEKIKEDGKALNNDDEVGHIIEAVQKEYNKLGRYR